MCGIIGYTGNEEAKGLLLDGLKKLEYRGYDSAGIAVENPDGIQMIKTSGKVDKLVEKAKENDSLFGCCGIGHTRWATHGCPSDINAHPHMSEDKSFAIVHNGIIENYAALRDELTSEGVEFISDTDTEVIVQLLSHYYNGDIKKALRKTMHRLEGSYAIGVLCKDYPDTVFAAKVSSPLIIGLGAGENYFASDITALVNHTKNVIDLEDGELAEISPDKVIFYNHNGQEIKKQERYVTWDIGAAEKNGYDHFMLKEICEQPAAIKATLDPRIKDNEIYFEGLDIDVKKYNRIIITACGSAYYAGSAGKNLIEKLCRIPVEAEVASELRYSDPIIDENSLVIAISQSGETADTIAAIKECKEKGAALISIVNVVGSSVAKLSDYVLYTWAGPEIAVATTKGYTTQLCILVLFAMWYAKKLGKLDDIQYRNYINEIKSLPKLAQRTLDLNSRIQELAKKYYNQKSIFFIGRNLDYSVCLEGSLKLKEISYIHSEAYAAGELKHGTIALIEPGRLVVALCCYEKLLEKTISNIQQVKARGADVVAVTTENNKSIIRETDNALLVPACNEIFMPVIEIIPLQLFAYNVALCNGCDIDKPKNLAKSVTVE